MEIRVLRYFLAVAREGTIVGAAKFLHVTQPTLSRQLQDLEEELGQQLFIRSNRTITLTPEGRFLRKRAEEILEIVNRTEGDFNAMGENIGGSVHIGGGESKAMRLVAETIGELREEHPDIRYNLYSGNAEDVMERLDKGILDFGVLIQPVDISKYDSVALPIRDTWGLVMRKDSPLAAKTAITLRDLRNLPLICSRINIRQSTVKNAYAEWFGKSFEKLNIVAANSVSARWNRNWNPACTLYGKSIRSFPRRRNSSGSGFWNASPIRKSDTGPNRLQISGNPAPY